MKKPAFRIYAIILSIAICSSSLLLTSCGTQSPSKITETMLQALKDKDSDTLKATYSGNMPTSSDSALISTLMGFDNTSENKKSNSSGEENIIANVSKNITSKNKKILKYFEKKILSFDYRITNEKINGNSASVKVEFTTYDCRTVWIATMQDYIPYYFNSMNLMSSGVDKNSAISNGQNSFFYVLKNQLDDLKKKDMSRTVTLTLKKSGNKWKVQNLSDKALDAISGGLTTSRNDVSSIIASEN